MATKTINLTGAEVAVTGLDGAHAHITNMGADIIYAAKNAGITAGADGVVPIPAGNGNTLRGISGAVYLMGTGSVLVQSDDYVQHPSFRNSTASGGSGVDDLARAAINEHAGNAEMHVTAAEKAAWDGKAELTDIPTSLPANGGNADTLDGMHASDITLSFVNKYKPLVVSVAPTSNSVMLGWLPVDGATKYAVSRYDPTTKKYIDYSLEITNTNYTATGLSSDTAYQFLVQAYVNNKWSKFTTSDHIITNTLPDYATLEARVATLENGGTT